MSLARRFLRLLTIIALVLNIDFIHAILKVINYLVFEIVNNPQLLVNTV